MHLPQLQLEAGTEAVRGSETQPSDSMEREDDGLPAPPPPPPPPGPSTDAAAATGPSKEARTSAVSATPESTALEACPSSPGLDAVPSRTCSGQELLDILLPLPQGSSPETPILHTASSEREP